MTFKEARRAAMLKFVTCYVETLLVEADGNVAKAARNAGIDRTYLIRLMRRVGLKGAGNRAHNRA